MPESEYRRLKNQMGGGAPVSEYRRLKSEMDRISIGAEAAPEAVEEMQRPRADIPPAPTLEQRAAETSDIANRYQAMRVPSFAEKQAAERFQHAKSVYEERKGEEYGIARTMGRPPRRTPARVLRVPGGPRVRVVASARRAEVPTSDQSDGIEGRVRGVGAPIARPPGRAGRERVPLGGGGR